MDIAKNKSANIQTLKELFIGEVEIIDEISIDGIAIHSATIKSLLKEGNISLANRLLGREYCIEGRVIKGQGLGKKSLFPTLNINTINYQLPLNGVYMTKTFINNKWSNSITFLGHRISTDGNFALETHIIDKDIESIKDFITIKFIEFIRENKKFESLNLLKKQILDDIRKVKDRV